MLLDGLVFLVSCDQTAIFTVSYHMRYTAKSLLWVLILQVMTPCENNGLAWLTDEFNCSVPLPMQD